MDSAIAEPLGPDDPREIGQFAIVGLLGAGGMGEVYLGTTEKGHVAVKRVRARLVSGERFKREVGVLYRVPAGVAPSVLAHDSTAERPWFATEYVPGVTVDDAVRLNGPLPAESLWLLLAETAAQLQAVHAARIVHRDVKPANVMLVRDGVKLIDFGIARAADQTRLTRNGESYGTHGFTAPEQDAGRADVASPADVYSLGALLLYAASGRMPGVIPDLEPLRAEHPDLATVVESCLATDPDERPTAAALVESAWTHLPATDASWPRKVADRIAVRRRFAATPVGKMETLPPPDLEPRPDPALTPPSGGGSGGGSAPEPSIPSKTRRWRFVLPIVAVLLLGGLTAFVLVPDTSPQHSHASASSAATPTPDHASPAATNPGTATATQPIRSTSASAAATPAVTATTVSLDSPGRTTPASSAAATRAAANPTASSINGIDGGSDTAQVEGSEADTSWMGNDATCSAWLDDNGSGGLAGVLNTSMTQSCVAELFRSDGMAYTFSASWGAKKTNFISDVGYSMWICVWHADDESTDKECSHHFTMNGDTPVQG